MRSITDDDAAAIARAVVDEQEKRWKSDAAGGLPPSSRTSAALTSTEDSGDSSSSPDELVASVRAVINTLRPARRRSTGRASSAASSPPVAVPSRRRSLRTFQVDPFAKVLPVGRKSRGKEQLRVDEARTYLRHCLKAWETDRDRGAVAALLAMMFSLRASEVSQLRARDVDDRGRILRIAEHQSKTEASKRAAAVPPVLMPESWPDVKPDVPGFSSRKT